MKASIGIHCNWEPRHLFSLQITCRTPRLPAVTIDIKYIYGYKEKHINLTLTVAHQDQAEFERE